MEAHIVKGLELISNLYLSRKYNKFLARVLGINREIAGDLLRKSYALHDIGKCLQGFQTRKGSFGFHEFYSHLVAGKVLKKFGDAGEIASVAILLHHHDWIKNRSPPKPESLRLNEECLSLLEEVTGERLPRDIPWKEPKVALAEAEGTLRKNLRGVYALLLPIVVADNYAAARNRGGKGSLLGREILETLSVRGWNFARDIPGGL